MFDLSAEPQEVQSPYPPSYDLNGRSLFYNEAFVSRSRQSRRLFITRPLRFGNPNELELIDVSSDIYPDIPAPYYALKEYLRTSFGERKTPTYIFDDHNHALFAWSEALQEGVIEKGAKLFHYDDHLDGKKKVQQPLPDEHDLKGVAGLAQHIDHDVFIEPAVKSGLVNKVYWIERFFTNPESYEEDQHQIAHTTLGSTYIPEVIGENSSPEKTIIDIDLDYFTYIDNPEQVQQEIQRLRECMKKAGVITMAISPGFLDEQRAVDLIQKLLAV